MDAPQTEPASETQETNKIRRAILSAHHKCNNKISLCKSGFRTPKGVLSYTESDFKGPSLLPRILAQPDTKVRWVCSNILRFWDLIGSGRNFGVVLNWIMLGYEMFLMIDGQ